VRLSRERLRDGRLRLIDGPMDLLVAAEGSAEAVRAAEAAATACAARVLDALCAELALLRRDARDTPAASPVGRLMQGAVREMPGFITPMAAVAGSVAEHVLGAMVEAAPLSRAHVNNGGDIALHLAPGERVRIGLARPGAEGLHGAVTVEAADAVRGIATSGWPGRSFSLGIADAVTITARTASLADAAATVVANAVDLPGHEAVERVPARALAPDSDLGDRLVTRGVGALSEEEIARALDAGCAMAVALRERGLIEGAVLCLKGRVREPLRR
jgi:ApbE superfamily uncharacterized protein (UPF0280 family)